MIRLVLFLIATALAAVGLGWLADRPGQIVLDWQGYEVQTSVFRAVVLLALLVGTAIVLWSVLRQLWTSPATVGRVVNRRRQERGMEALSSGMIAVGAGDRTQAMRFALQARKSLPNEPLTHVLRAQAAQLAGDRATARRVFEAMLGSPETEQLGLRGLFLEADREGEREAARQFAERALRLNPKLAWPIDALFELQCKASDWSGALETLSAARKAGHLEKALADRRRAVLLAAQAQAIEDENPERALALATEAHNLALDLVEPAAIAGRVLSSRGQTGKVARVIEQTWKRAPHPDLAVAYAYARPGDSPRDRLERVKSLARTAPHSLEAPLAVATCAIEARDWPEARKALEPLLESRLTQRVCTLMARIEAEQNGNAGRVREWLARAVNAPRDPAWTADGVIADRWGPISPVTGTLDAFQWKVPVAQSDTLDERLALAKLEELVQLGARSEKVIETAQEKGPISTDVPAVAASPAPTFRAATLEPVLAPPIIDLVPKAVGTVKGAASPGQGAEEKSPGGEKFTGTNAGSSRIEMTTTTAKAERSPPGVAPIPLLAKTKWPLETTGKPSSWAPDDPGVDDYIEPAKPSRDTQSAAAPIKS